MSKQPKPLKDLNLLDRFLFAEAMENPETVKDILEIIFGHEIAFEQLPQTEKEQRRNPLQRFVKLDVWAMDQDKTVYDAEVQKRNTHNLPKRSRLYQGVIDSDLLPPGVVDFNKLNDAFVILISPFDIFGYDRYRYTFQMQCLEIPELSLEDGATRIFLNTHGTDPEHISTELAELLRYMEDTSEETSNQCQSPRIHNIQTRIQQIKSNEDIGVKYMQAWEEKILDRLDALEEGRSEGRTIEQLDLIRKKMSKGLSCQAIAEFLETEEDDIRTLMNCIASHPDLTNEQICELLKEQSLRPANMQE